MVLRTPAKKTFYLKDHLKSCTLCSRISCTLYSRINCTVWSRILKKAQKVLSNIETRESPELFDEEDLDFIFKSNPNIRVPTGEESINSRMTPEDENDGFVELMAIEFFGGDNNRIYLPNLFEFIRKELQENLLMPIEKYKVISYIDEALNLFIPLEEQIVEDEEGEFKNYAILLCKGEMTNQIDRDLYSGTLRSWKLSLRQEILYLRNLKSKLSQNNSESKLELNNKTKEKSEKGVKNIDSLKNKSFQIESTDSPNSIEFNDKLKSFKDELERNRFIAHMDYRLFKKVFTNEIVDQPIIWIGKPTELYYLLKSLHDKGIIKKFNNYWQVTCICFQLNDGSGRKLTPSYLQRCGPPKEYKRGLLDAVIDPLE